MSKLKSIQNEILTMLKNAQIEATPLFLKEDLKKISSSNARVFIYFLGSTQTSLIEQNATFIIYVITKSLNPDIKDNALDLIEKIQDTLNLKPLENKHINLVGMNTGDIVLLDTNDANFTYSISVQIPMKLKGVNR